MANVKAIRDRIKLGIETGLSHTVFVYDTMPSTPTVPCAIVSVSPGDFLADITLDGVEDLRLVVLVLVQKVVDSVAQDTVDTYLSEGSSNIAAAIDSGSTSDWDYAVTEPARNYGQYVFGEGDAALRYLGYEIPVSVGVS